MIQQLIFSLSTIFFIIAVFFNAAMDAFENENFYESIFKNWDQKFWYKRESWKYSTKIFNYHFDAWHLSKTLFLFFIFLSIVTFRAPINDIFDAIIYLGHYGSIWIILFWLFYHKLFQIK